MGLLSFIELERQRAESVEAEETSETGESSAKSKRKRKAQPAVTDSEIQLESDSAEVTEVEPGAGDAG